MLALEQPSMPDASTLAVVCQGVTRDFVTGDARVTPAVQR